MELTTPAPPLRILQLASHSSLARGGAVQMIRLARGLAERGHTVTAAFNLEPGAEPTGEAVERARAAGVRLEGLTLAGDGAALRALWRAGRFDVLHVHREAALLAAADALRGEPIPCFIAQRGTVYLPGFLSAEHRLLFSSRIHRIIAVAQAVKQALVWRRLIPPGKIAVVYGGVETDVFHPDVSGLRLRLRHGVPQGTNVVTLPGALIEKKGPRFFIQAAAQVRKRRQGVRFWLVGQGKLEGELRALCDELELGAQVEFLGHIDNMPEVYAASDLVVCASVKGEGLTGTLREALAMQRPVVTTNCAGNTELAEEGQTGYVAPMAHAGALAAAILRALNDPAEAHRRATAGRARTLAWCSEPQRSTQVESIYRQVLAT